MKFEENLSRLEQTVARMESGELKLDDMIAKFEEGQNLVRECTKELESIRARIEKVTAQGVEEIELKAEPKA